MSELPRTRFAQSPLLVLAAAIAVGVFLGHYLAPKSQSVLIFSIAVGVGFAALSVWLARKRQLASASVVLVATFLLAGLILSLIENHSLALHRISRMYQQGIIISGDPVELTGTIDGQPEPAPESFYLKLRAERIGFRGVELNASGTVLLLAHTRDRQVEKEYDALELRHGARIRVMTSLDREEDFRNPGVLPFTEYLERKGYDATGVIRSPLLVERLDDDRVFLPLAWLFEWRERLEKEFGARFSAETAGVLDAALLGNRYNVSHAVAERLRAGGTFHVLVIAGLHIGFVAWLIFMFVRRMTKKRLLQFVVAVGLVWAYVIAVGAHMPVVRAALMFTLIIFAPLVWRRANSLNVIGGAALVLLVMQPSDLFDPSFQLTFVSVLSIVLIAVPLLARMQSVGAWRPTTGAPYPPDCARWFRRLSEALFWNDREWRADMARSNISYKLFKTPIAANLERWHIQKLLRYALAAIVVSASVQMGMLPFLIIYFHRLSFASIALNIFVGVLMALLAFVGLAAIAVSHLSPWVGSLLIVCAEKIGWIMAHLVDPFTRLGVASIRLPHYSGMAACVYVLYFIPLGFLIYELTRWNPLRPVSISKVHNKILSPIRLRIAATVFAGLLALIVFHPLSAARPDGQLHIDFLDVGQGDSALLTMPDGTTVLIDGGGKPNITHDTDDGEVEDAFERDTRSIGEGVVSEYLWSRGMDRVDYLLPTHADADHIDGLNDIAQNFKVRGAIVARTPANDPEYVRFATTMKAAGVQIEKIGAGDVLHFGKVSADVLWPPPIADPDAPWRNNDGIVLRVRHGDHSFLFTADIEKKAEAGVLSESVNLQSSVVKVAHHGSKTSSTDPFVAATHPSLAIISVGRTSPFGHPSKEVVERWRASGAEVMTTGEKGTISITTDGHTLKTVTFVR